jgi:beta-lactamase regulating signal transducer with metallopeptidase domain
VNAYATLAAWREPFVVLAVGGALLVAVAAAWASQTASGAGRRAAWQGALLGLTILLLVELTGSAAGLTSWLLNSVGLPPTTSEEAIGPVLGKQAEAVERLPRPSAVNKTNEPDAEDVDADSASDEEPSMAWWPGALWLAGATLVMARACAARVLLAWFRRHRRRIADAMLTKLIRSLAAQLSYRRAVEVIEAGALLTPAAFGILRPTLALPARFCLEFTPQQQEAMLAHELAHLALRDPAWQLFADLATALFWWHPLAWWARRQFRAACELAADEASAVVADGPEVLAACLVDLGNRLAGRRAPAWLSMAGNGFRSGLGRRVERLLRLRQAKWRRPGRARRMGVLVLGPMLLVAVSALSMAWARSPALAEGDVPMKSAWKRSLAAVMFVALLGSADPAPGDDQPAGSDAKSGGRAEKKTEKRLEERARDLRAQQAGVAAELDAVIERLATLDLDLSQVKDGDAEKIRQALRELAAKAKELEKTKARLEKQLKALQDEKARDEKMASATRIKVFRLKHRDPNEISAVLTELLPQPQPGQVGMMGAAGMVGAGPGMMGGMMGMMGGKAGMMPGGGGGGMMGASGGFAGGKGFAGGGPGMGIGGAAGFPRTAANWRLAVDARTNSLIVRGTEEDLRTIADIIAALDLPEGKSTAKLKNFRTFRLKHANAQEVAGIVQELDVKVTVAALEQGNLLAASGSESALKEVADLIEALDVEAKPTKDIKKNEP